MKYFPVPFLAITLLTTQAIAQTEELIVTGSYHPVTHEQLSSSVSIINKKELLQLGSNLMDALRQIPGLWIEEQGGPGGITSISLRGAEANHTLVLLDGVQLNDPTNTRGGAVDINNLNIEYIDRIEIIRGAQSAVYGSDALAGVIHIITQPPGKTTRSLHASIGSDDYASAGASAAGTLSKVGYAFAIQTRDAGEPVPGSTAKNTEFTNRLHWAQENHTLNFSYRYFDGERTGFPEQSGGPEFAIDRNLDHSKYTDQNAGLGWTLQIHDQWQTRMQTHWYQRQEQFASPGIAPYFQLPPNGVDIDFDRITTNWTNTFGDKNSYWFNVGAEHRREQGTNLGYVISRNILPLDFSLARDINSIFLNANMYTRQNWLLQASVRYDNPDNYSTKNTHHFGTRYQFNEQIALFANLGEGFKLPSFFALGHPMTGNTSLAPETVTSGDIGFEWTGKHFSLHTSYFAHHYRNLIDFDAELFKNVNRARVQTRGVESELNWQIDNNFEVRSHASYTDIDMLSSSNHLLGRPQVTYGTSLHYTPTSEWQFNLNYLRVDERFAMSRHTGTGVEQTLAAYHRVDASTQWQINKIVQLRLSLENLTNENYYTDIGFPSAGAYGKASIDFQF